MSEISNKTLVGLLVVAIVISLAGTFLSLNKLGELGSITGFQANQTTQSGTTSVEILATASLTLYNATMDFGDGAVNGTYTGGFDFCVMSSNSSVNYTDLGWSTNDFSDQAVGIKTGPCVDGGAGVGFFTPYSFAVENTGNINFSDVYMNSSNGGNTFFVNTFPSGTSNGNWSYRVAAEDGSDACSGGGPSANWALVANASVCTQFGYGGDTSDAFTVQMQVALPEDAPPAAFTDTIEFYGVV